MTLVLERGDIFFLYRPKVDTTSVQGIALKLEPNLHATEALVVGKWA
jgi:hypothetical protein